MPFVKGKSGNPGGRPKGIKTFSIRALVAEAISDPATQASAIQQLRANLAGRKTVLSAFEFAAKVNREIGLGAGEGGMGLAIVFVSNLKADRLLEAKPRALPAEASGA